MTTTCTSIFYLCQSYYFSKDDLHKSEFLSVQSSARQLSFVNHNIQKILKSSTITKSKISQVGSRQTSTQPPDNSPFQRSQSAFPPFFIRCLKQSSLQLDTRKCSCIFSLRTHLQGEEVPIQTRSLHPAFLKECDTD